MGGRPFCPICKKERATEPVRFGLKTYEMCWECEQFHKDRVLRIKKGITRMVHDVMRIRGTA